MPALPMKISRRKRVLPAAIIAGETFGGPWVEDDYTNKLTLETSKIANTAARPNSGDGDMVPPLQVVNADPPVKKTWFDLPEEIQSQIIEDCTANDLIALSLVSKRFQVLTAQRLYQKFQIIFPDDDDVSFDGSIDSLAAGLETFATSDFNYARFLREVSLDTITSGSKGERAYRRYTSDESCGKFMNTLMLLTMRQASKLETFHWNIRVELSRPLYKALHNITTLQHLHLRMHPGSTSYQRPPPLPSMEDEQEDVEIVRDKDIGLTVTDMLFHSSLRNDKTKQAKSKQPLKDSPDPPTISGFKDLKTLEVLDMDTLDYVSEIKQAIENSTGTLTKLKISFSEHLARQARKPPTPVDNTDDSEGELDEFGNSLAPPPPPPPMPSSDDGNAPQKALHAQEAKKEQEAVLGKLFGIETALAKKDRGPEDTTAVVDDGDKEEARFEKDGQRFIKNIMLISKKLMTSMSPNRTQQQKEALEIIENAAKKYVEEKKAQEDEKKVEKDKKKGAKEKTSENSDAKKSDDSKAEDTDQDKDETSSGLFNEKDDTKKNKADVKADDESSPDDIDVVEPEIIDDENDLEDAIAEEDIISEENTAVKEHEVPVLTWGQLEKQIAKYQDDHIPEEELPLYEKIKTALGAAEVENDQRDSTAADAESSKAAYELQTMYDTRKKAESEEELKKVLAHSTDSTDTVASKRTMGEYIRSTRGLQLSSLAIYLIPIKASILSRAVDLHCLKRITLLNVGPQSAFWTHMTKENALRPLPLQKIHTDNVSPAFLKFVEGMEKCTELFLLERNSKSEVTAQKTEVNITQIRKALRNQWPHLKRLVLRNESGYEWDAKERFLETLCRRGTNLEELGIAFSSKGVHHLLQDFHGLKNLRAFHIIGFRNDDTCHWVLREVRKFIVDIVAHHREMKLEYIAQDNSVERIIWEKPKPKKPKAPTPKVDLKGKGKAVATASSVDGVYGGGYSGNATPIFPSLTTMVAGPKEESSSSEDESEDDGSGGSGSVKESKKGLKCKTQEQGKFYDVFGVRMWKKEVLSARI